MNARLLALVRNDVRLQYRNGIYAAYSVVLVLYAVVLTQFARVLPDFVPALIIFTDPAALGFFFLGALMMLERGERVRASLATSPVSAVDYLAAKAVTLTGMALAACAILLLFLHDVANPALLLLTVALTSVAYIGIGVPIALRFRTVNGYLIGSAGFLTPIIAPGFVALLDTPPLWAMLLPAAAQFRLILVSTGAASASAGEIGFMLAVCAVAAAGAIWLALWALRRELGK